MPGRFLFPSAPLSAHFLPLVPLAWAFRPAGHEVLTAVPENFVPTALRSGLPVTSCGPAVDFTPDLPVRPSPRALDRPAQRHTHGLAFARIARSGLPGLGTLMDEWRPDLVVSERAESAGPLAAAVRGIPWVKYHWSVSRLDEYAHAAAQEFAPEIGRTGLGGHPVPAAVLDPWPASLRLPHARGHLAVRHTPSQGDAEVPGWARTRSTARVRVCVTAGTLLPRHDPGGVPEPMMSVLEGLAGLGVDMAVAVDDDLAAGWPPLPAAVRHAGRLPLAEVLRTCDLVVHHGGQGTSLTALAAGIPQLIVPGMDDQFDNAEALARAGAAITVPAHEAVPELLTKCAAELLEDVAHQGAAARLADEIRRQPAPSHLVEPLCELAG